MDVMTVDLDIKLYFIAFVLGRLSEVNGDSGRLRSYT